ncbi:hypothetical protein BDB01DRAFT_838816 [Pilobolus umbonatus]|nr:hypothetical protein BDB01DRAFT_838816 [Pilobolus umbonatus]
MVLVHESSVHAWKIHRTLNHSTGDRLSITFSLVFDITIIACHSYILSSLVTYKGIINHNDQSILILGIPKLHRLLMENVHVLHLLINSCITTLASCSIGDTVAFNSYSLLILTFNYVLICILKQIAYIVHVQAKNLSLNVIFLYLSLSEIS